MPRPADLDTAYLAFFVGLRVNALVTEALHANGYTDVREADGYLVQHLVEGPRTITELARRMGVTQQAASKAVADLKRRKLVAVHVSEDNRARDVELAPRGHQLLAAARKARRAVDTRLSATCSPKELEALREKLTVMLETLGGVAAVRERRVRPSL